MGRWGHCIGDSFRLNGRLYTKRSIANPIQGMYVTFGTHAKACAGSKQNPTHYRITCQATGNDSSPFSKLLKTLRICKHAHVCWHVRALVVTLAALL